MMSNKAKKWLHCAGVRAVKTVAQTFVATVGTSAVMSATDVAIERIPAKIDAETTIFQSTALITALVPTVATKVCATVGTSAVMSAVDWKMVVSASILAGILSIATSVAGLPEVNADEDISEK